MRKQKVNVAFGRDGISGAEFLACPISGAELLACRLSRALFFAQPSLACRPGLKAPLARTGIRPRHSEAMAAEEDFYDLDVDAEEAVTEGRSPWAVGVSCRILCKRLSDPESTSGDGALSVYLDWPLPCVGGLEDQRSVEGHRAVPPLHPEGLLSAVGRQHEELRRPRQQGRPDCNCVWLFRNCHVEAPKPKWGG